MQYANHLVATGNSEARRNGLLLGLSDASTLSLLCAYVFDKLDEHHLRSEG